VKKSKISSVIQVKIASGQFIAKGTIYMVKGFLASVFVGVCFLIFVGNAVADEIAAEEVAANEVDATTL
jgi:hypothetical protein